MTSSRWTRRIQKNKLGSILSMPFTILYTCSISLLLLWCSTLLLYAVFCPPLVCHVCTMGVKLRSHSDTYRWNFNSSSITTPKSFSSGDASNGVSFIVYWCLALAVPRWITLHFASLNPNCHWRDHFTMLSRFCCIFSVPCGDFTLRNNLVSSAK